MLCTGSELMVVKVMEALTGLQAAERFEGINVVQMHAALNRLVHNT